MTPLCRQLVLLIIASFVASGADAAAPGQSQQGCQDLGFTGLALCSDCADLAAFVHDEELVAECLRCCAEESKQEETTFSSAVLEVCPHSLRGYPHIETFVNKHASEFPALRVKKKIGVPPRLVLSNRGAPPTVVRIDSWKTEHVVEYLQEKLGGAVAAAPGGGSSAQA